MKSAPNVLVVQMKRSGGVRPGVDAEMQLDVPGLPVMDLIGVVYHDGVTFECGHYTCVCRGPGGRFWMYDDIRAVPVDGEVAHIRPKQVYMLVYARRGGEAVWKRSVGDGSNVGDVVWADAKSGAPGGGRGCWQVELSTRVGRAKDHGGRLCVDGCWGWCVWSFRWCWKLECGSTGSRAKEGGDRGVSQFWAGCCWRGRFRTWESGEASG